MLNATLPNSTRPDGALLCDLPPNRRDRRLHRLSLAASQDFWNTRRNTDFGELSTQPTLLTPRNTDATETRGAERCSQRSRGERDDATKPLDTDGQGRNAPGTVNWDATDATDATNADATDFDAERADATHATDATDFETPAVSPAAVIPVEPTPAVRTQREPIICLGDLLETVALEISPTTCSLRCRNQFAGVLFHSCSANEGE